MTFLAADAVQVASGCRRSAVDRTDGAKIEAELVELEPAEAKAFLADLGVQDSGVSSLIRAVYALLGLQTYCTAGDKEVRAWTFKSGWKAPQAAG